MKLMILGHAAHGKDTVGELLRDTWDMKFVSSSYFMAEHVVLPKMQQAWQDYNKSGEVPEPPWPCYANVDECYKDRNNHRKFWYDAIKAANGDDLSYLSREIFSRYDLYVGLRNKRELMAARCADLFDFAIWVDASERKPPESQDSCTVEPWMADYILDNNGTPAQLERNVYTLMSTLRKKYAFMQ